MRLVMLVAVAAACRNSTPQPAKVAPVQDERLREVEAMLPDSSSFTLLAIAPQKPKSGDRIFHGYPILGEAPLSLDLLGGLRRDIARGGEKALCFWPRHALRSSGGVDVLICFQCTTVEVHRGSEVWRVPLTPTVKAAFDEALSKTGFVRPPEEKPLYEAN
jgi:hypothetical protein